MLMMQIPQFQQYINRLAKESGQSSDLIDFDAWFDDTLTWCENLQNFYKTYPNLAQKSDYLRITNPASSRKYISSWKAFEKSFRKHDVKAAQRTREAEAPRQILEVANTRQESVKSETAIEPVVSFQFTVGNETSSQDRPREIFEGESEILDLIMPRDLPDSLGPGDNAIVQRHIAIYGRQGIGKTNGARWIVEKAVERYGQSDVNVQVVKGEEFRKLLAPACWTDQPIQIRVLEDVTFAELNDEDLRDFFRIREVMQQNSGRRHGLCLVVFTCHRFHNTPISLRSDCDSILALSAPVEEYDYNYLVRRIGENDVRFLDKAEQERRPGAAVMTYRRSQLRGRGLQLRLQLPRINPQNSFMIAMENYWRKEGGSSQVTQYAETRTQRLKREDEKTIIPIGNYDGDNFMVVLRLLYAALSTGLRLVIKGLKENLQHP